jgi:uncharacterized protein YdhG (YjbR/CyaY superfamily)
MGSEQVDDYLEGAPEPHRTTLRVLRDTLAELLPGADETIAYGVPCFKVAGTGVAGFSYSAHHCTYLPMSGSVTAELAEELAGHRTGKGSVRFPADVPLDPALVRRLVDARRAEIARDVR